MRRYVRLSTYFILCACLVGLISFLPPSIRFHKWQLLNTAPFPDVCVLCQSRRYHAPCLVDLSSCAVTELAIYAPDPNREAELALEQNLGAFHYGGRNGILWYSDSANGYCRATLSPAAAGADFSLLCSGCRTALQGLPLGGCVLADLYGNSPVFYPLNAAPTRFRGYTVTVSAGGTTLRVHTSAELRPNQ